MIQIFMCHAKINVGLILMNNYKRMKEYSNRKSMIFTYNERMLLIQKKDRIRLGIEEISHTYRQILIWRQFYIVPYSTLNQYSIRESWHHLILQFTTWRKNTVIVFFLEFEGKRGSNQVATCILQLSLKKYRRV